MLSVGKILGVCSGDYDYWREGERERDRERACLNNYTAFTHLGEIEKHTQFCFGKPVSKRQ
jgi:hypothetical protein